LQNVHQTFTKQENVLKGFTKRSEKIHKTFSKDSQKVQKTFSIKTFLKLFEDSQNVLKTYTKRSPKNHKVLKTFSKESQSSENVQKRSQSKRFQNVLNQNALKTFTKRSVHTRFPTLVSPLGYTRFERFIKFVFGIRNIESCVMQSYHY
jgi:prophage DNA circulation protein